MKSTNAFQDTIKTYLDQRAKEDELFAVSYAKEGKTIDNCCTYILNTVQKSGNNGFTDEEIFGMAVHYYDEDKIEVGKPVSGRVVVNHTVELTKDEIKQARQKAIEKLQNETIASAKKKPSKAKKEEIGVQTSLFD